MSKKPYIPWINTAGLLRPDPIEDKEMNDKDVGLVFNKPSMEIDFTKLKILSMEPRSSSPFDRFIITVPPTDILRTIKLENGSVKYIDELYWDTYDDTPQEREEFEREFEIKGTYITIEMHLKKASIRRLDEIQEELRVSFADVNYNVEDELADRLLSNNIVIEKIFKDHKRNVCNGEDGHTYAMALQDRFWKEFGGRMKTLLRLKYKAIGFDPDVWCK